MAADPFKPVLKVLLVDDVPDTRQVVAVMLEKAGHVVFATESGDSALSLLNHEKVDVIVLDILMPEMDGLSVLKTIRGTSQAPILMLTAISNAGIMEQSYLMGADDYMVKPFTREKLIARIERLAARVKPAIETSPSNLPIDCWLDVDNHLLIKGGTAINLTELETKIMSRLMETAGMEVSTGELYQAGWGGDHTPLLTMRSMVETVIKDLQSKIEADPDFPQIILPTRDGFTFNPDQT